jgi:hypothetical protein
MSLRAFHVLFIILSILMSAGCAWWAFANGVALLFGVVSVVVAVGLIAYAVYFLRKTKKLIL